MAAIKPTPASALLRLRLDDDLMDDVTAAIDQAFAQTQKYLCGPLFATQAEVDAAALNPKAILCTADIIAAQLLLVDAIAGPNTTKEAADKREAAYSMLRIHRNQGV